MVTVNLITAVRMRVVKLGEGNEDEIGNMQAQPTVIIGIIGMDFRVKQSGIHLFMATYCMWCFSVVSEGGTRHVRRKKKNADGTYGDSESYHSSDSGMFENGGKGRKGKKGNKKPRKKHDSDSDNSYYSVVSAGGTRRQMIKKRIRDKDGKIIGNV